MTEWIVDARDAYARWVEVEEPSLIHDFAMTVWIVERERNGPPAVIGLSSRGHTVARGPHGEEIEFSVVPRPLTFVARPPWGIIAIHSIS